MMSTDSPARIAEVIDTAAQATDEERLAAADVTLDGSGAPEALRAEVDALWERIVQETAEELA